MARVSARTFCLMTVVSSAKLTEPELSSSSSRNRSWAKLVVKPCGTKHDSHPQRPLSAAGTIQVPSSRSRGCKQPHRTCITDASQTHRRRILRNHIASQSHRNHIAITSHRNHQVLDGEPELIGVEDALAGGVVLLE